MVRKIYSTQPILIIAVILLFLLFFSLIFFVDQLYLSDYILMGLLLVTILVSLFSNMTYGLIMSVVVLFGYISLVFYGSVFYGKSDINPNYIWIIAFPVLTSAFGYLGDVMHETAGYVKKLNNNNEALVTIDSTSGLGNIKGFYKVLSGEIARAKRHEFPLSIMLLEIQEVEELISLYGKENYGNIIIIITNALNKASRIEDYCYRMSDKTFGLIMPITDEKGALVLKERIKELLIDVNVIEDKALQSYSFDVRIGVKQYDDSIKEEFAFKREAEKEVEFDV